MKFVILANFLVDLNGIKKRWENLGCFCDNKCPFNSLHVG